MKSSPTTVGLPLDVILVKKKKRKERRKGARPAEVNVIYKKNSYPFVAPVQEAA